MSSNKVKSAVDSREYDPSRSINNPEIEEQNHSPLSYSKLKKLTHHLVQRNGVDTGGCECLGNLLEADPLVWLAAAVHVEPVPILLNQLAAVADLGEPQRRRRPFEEVAQFRELWEVFVVPLFRGKGDVAVSGCVSPF